MAVIEAIATQYLEAAVTSVTFSSIPSTYKHLQLKMSAKGDWSNVSTASYGAIRLNGDTGSNYGIFRFDANGSSPAFDTQVGNSEMYLTRFSSMGTPTVPVTHYGTVVLDIFDYANTNTKTTCVSMSGVMANTALHMIQFGSGYWDNTAAVHTILIDQSGGSNFVRGSEFTLYGLKDS